MTIESAIKKITLGNDLTEEEMREVVNLLVSGNVTSSQIGGFLIGLKAKGETSKEIVGAVKALKDNMKALEVSYDNLIDTCGTGGDGGSTFNVSTAVAIVAASGGVKVAKHGNRAVSSKSGSADVLTELGIKIDLTAEESKEFIEKYGMSFLFAPNYHSAMRHVAKERKELGTRTIFNLLGPLVNPAPIRGQLLGIYDGELLPTIGEVLMNLGLDRALIVHGEDGLDEITTTSQTRVCEINNGEMKLYSIKPEDFGITRAKLEELKGGDAKENSQIILEILKGKEGPCTDIVIMNAGAALYVGKATESVAEGVALAKELIKSGKAFEKYKQLSGF